MMQKEIKILCVDDELNVLSALRRLFMDEEYTIITASSALEGISTLERETVQIVISDYRMPSMNGVEFLREVYKRWPDTVRIVLSGYADASAIVGAINEGHIYKFIPKPWNDEELKVTIINSIERYYLYKENMELTEELKEKNEELGKLLEEKSRSLEFRSRSLSVHQALLDAMPIGIMGVDSNDMVVMCNTFCLGTCTSEGGIIGNTVDNILPEFILKFIRKVKDLGKAVVMAEMDGRRMKIIGALIEQRGIVLVFIPEDNSL